ncbi:MAG: caspase family protein [Bacteroidota bacterium]
MKTNALSLLVGLILLLVPAALSAQGEADQAESRVALVIGNGDYLSGPLNNTVNDARSMARVLRNVGFDVILRENLSNKDEMKKAIREFGFKLKTGGTGLFYYAGHGIQVNGFNYIIPVNSVISTESDVEYEGVDMGFVLAQMESANTRVNIVILDACRNNPFARSFRDTRMGLVTMNAPTGTLIAYATAPGSVASDGTGVNGLYTQELLYQMQRPGLKVEEVFKNVRAEVVAKSEGKQTPWESSSLIGDFSFFGDGSAGNSEAASKTTSAADVATWKASSKGYSFYINDVDVTNGTTFAENGNDAIITYVPANKKYLLRNYWVNRDSRLRMAENYVPDPSAPENIVVPEYDPVVTWKGSADGYYWLYFDGNDVSRDTEYEQKGGDLLVTHKSTGKKYLLKDFVKNLDGNVRPAEKVGGSSGTQSVTTTAAKSGTAPVNFSWKATPDGTYFLRVDGNEISKETTYELKGEDLVVTHKASGRTFVLKSFVRCLDDTWRQGRSQ